MANAHLMWCRVQAKNSEEGNSVVELYVQIGTDDLTTRSLLDLVSQVCNHATSTIKPHLQIHLSIDAHLPDRTCRRLSFCVRSSVRALVQCHFTLC